MDSYVVRIYRRDPKDPRGLVGVVERAGAEGEQTFHDLTELMAILASTGTTRESAKGWGGKKWRENT